MRARYSAFVVARGDFLAATGSRDPAPSLAAWSRSVSWLGLNVLEHQAGQTTDSTGIVRFVARYIEAGQLVSLSELSRFERRAGQWFYLDGDAEVTRRSVERNAPCPCGSGKKYKQCHA